MNTTSDTRTAFFIIHLSNLYPEGPWARRIAGVCLALSFCGGLTSFWGRTIFSNTAIIIFFLTIGYFVALDRLGKIIVKHETLAINTCNGLVANGFGKKMTSSTQHRKESVSAGKLLDQAKRYHRICTVIRATT